MAADDEFPRGLVQSGGSVASAALTITFPATPGIAWVLTHVDYSLLFGAGTVGPTNIDQLVVTSLTTSGPQFFVGGTQPTNEYFSAEDSWDGQAAAPAGSALTVSVGALPGATASHLLVAHAYPI